MLELTVLGMYTPALELRKTLLQIALPRPTFSAHRCHCYNNKADAEVETETFPPAPSAMEALKHKTRREAGTLLADSRVECRVLQPESVFLLPPKSTR